MATPVEIAALAADAVVILNFTRSYRPGSKGGVHDDENLVTHHAMTQFTNGQSSLRRLMQRRECR